MTAFAGTIGAATALGGAPRRARERPSRDPGISGPLADAVRTLAGDSLAAAETRLPSDTADTVTALWTRFHKYDAADPRWPDRDRFVCSGLPGERLLEALNRLTGHPAADPFGDDSILGQPGHGLGTAVGLALAERMLAARFGRSLVDHRTWVLASDDDLMEGLSHEAASLAGHLRLEKLTVLWHPDHAPDAAVSSDDHAKRFAAMGWAVRPADAQDADSLAAALAVAMRSRKPTLVAIRPAEAASRPARLTQAVVQAWRRAGARGAAARRGWLKRLARHPLRSEFERVIAGRLPETFHDALAGLKASIAGSNLMLATSEAGGRAIAAFAPSMPELVGGSSGSALGATRLPLAPAAQGVKPGSYAGRHVDFGMRGQGMAACLNGMALHGGLLPCGGAGSALADALRPALRVAAAKRQRVVHVVVDDGLAAPVEQLAALRAMPNLHVFRPADAIETAECWELALRRTDGPSLLALCGRTLPPVRVGGGESGTENRAARGGYVVAEAAGPRQTTLIASGAEVALALEAQAILARSGIAAAVVSLPCWELFARQDEVARAAVLGGALRVGIEAASGFGWERWLGASGIFIGVLGVEGSGFAAPSTGAPDGISAETIAAAVRRRIGERAVARKD